MKLDLEQAGAWVVARVAGELTMDNSDGLVSQLRACFDRLKPAGCVIDLSAVTVLDSAGIGALVGTLHHLRRQNAQLRLSGVAGKVLMTLQVAHADRLFDLRATPAAALAG